MTTPVTAYPAPSRKMKTYTGVEIDLLDPDYRNVNIQDIAWALAGQIRFNGQHPLRLTVAQHSVDVMRRIPEHHKPLRLAALLHDAPEAYLGDVVSPLKYRDEMTAYREIEAKWERSIRTALRVMRPLDHPAVKAADRAQLKFELDLWDDSRGYRVLTPEEAYRDFLKHYVKLQHPALVLA